VLEEFADPALVESLRKHVISLLAGLDALVAEDILRIEENIHS
jgi:hypothetical protein